MATSGIATFNMDFTEIAEEAWERAGREMRSGYDFRTARRSMNLLTIEWQNRGINMWTIEEGFINLVKGQSQYPLPVETIDLLEQVIRTGQGSQNLQSDLTISRISMPTYASIPNKLAQLKEYLNLNAPLYENYILFAGGTQCDILGATGSRFVIYMHESQAEEVRSFIGKLCKGLQLYIGDRNGIPQRV